MSYAAKAAAQIDARNAAAAALRRQRERRARRDAALAAVQVLAAILLLGLVASAAIGTWGWIVAALYVLVLETRRT